MYVLSGLPWFLSSEILADTFGRYLRNRQCTPHFYLLTPFTVTYAPPPLLKWKQSTVNRYRFKRYIGSCCRRCSQIDRSTDQWMTIGWLDDIDRNLKNTIRCLMRLSSKCITASSVVDDISQYLFLFFSSCSSFSPSLAKMPKNAVAFLYVCCKQLRLNLVYR